MSADQPFVSIVLPTYNVEPYLRAAVSSVITQTHAEWELIVIDDGSTDGTGPYLRGLAGDGRIRVLARSHCGNPARLRNEGLAAARGDYVAFLDADDAWSPEKLEIQLQDLRRHAACGWSYTLTSRIDERGAALRLGVERPARPIAGWILEDVITMRATIALPSVMAATEFLRNVGGFDETFLFCSDYELWTRLAAASPARAVPLPLVHVRSHAASHTYSRRVEVWESWVRLYDQLPATLPAQRLAPLARVRRDECLVELAHAYRRAGRSGASFGALRRAAPGGMVTRDWWVALVKGLFRPLAGAPGVARRR
jgi:glycosyltransferase involved in cell wall biosynthesis